MSGRGFWFVVGAGAGLYASVRGRRLVYRCTPAGLADQLAAVEVGARAFAEEVRTGMAEKEEEVATALQLPRAVSVRRAAGRAPEPALDESPHAGPRALAASTATRSS
ncbi:MAG: DUF6167 family protein [Nocardioidaceae bacterium]